MNGENLGDLFKDIQDLLIQKLGSEIIELENRKKETEENLKLR